MTQPGRDFVNGFLALALPATHSAAPGLSSERRAFIDGFLEIVAVPPPAGPLAIDERCFVEEFVALARPLLSHGDATVDFQRLVVDRWQEITWRVHGAAAARLAGLDPSEQRFVRLLEDAPSLLGPLGRERDEVSHTGLLGWALRRPGELGRALRGAFASLVNSDVPDDGWLITTESVLGPGCRVDVDIEIPGRWRCLIEAKIDAAEREGQLFDYRQHLEGWCTSVNTGGELVFLTHDGRTGSASVQHLTLCWKHLLRAWLPLTDRPEPEALYARLWLASIAHDMYGISQPGPIGSWSFAQRIRMLEFLAGDQGGT